MCMIQMESIRKPRTALRIVYWSVSLNIQDAYLYVPIHPYCQQFLCFAVNVNRYAILVLPFDMSGSSDYTAISTTSSQQISISSSPNEIQFSWYSCCPTYLFLVYPTSMSLNTPYRNLQENLQELTGTWQDPSMSMPWYDCHQTSQSSWMYSEMLAIYHTIQTWADLIVGVGAVDSTTVDAYLQQQRGTKSTMFVEGERLYM